MKEQQQFPDFSKANWYGDPNDHRCPHDSWLESLEVTESTKGVRSEIRSTRIVIRLLGAYQDGQIFFRYEGVRQFVLNAGACERGLSDWLKDDFSTSETGLIKHHIVWASNAGRSTTPWLIECESLTYEWMPYQS